MPFILEGIVSTQNPDGSVNLAPMGPVVPSGQGTQIVRLLFRPFQESQTYRNLLSTKQGIFHVTDDVLLLSELVTKNQNFSKYQLMPAKKVQGDVIGSACRWYEFRILSCDQSSARAEFEAEVVHYESGRDFIGFNRAKHAVIETAILATRLHLLETEPVYDELKKNRTIIDKTAGDQEKKAFEMLCQFVRAEYEKKSLCIEDSNPGLLNEEKT